MDECGETDREESRRTRMAGWTQYGLWPRLYGPSSHRAAPVSHQSPLVSRTLPLCISSSYVHALLGARQLPACPSILTHMDLEYSNDGTPSPARSATGHMHSGHDTYCASTSGGPGILHGISSRVVISNHDRKAIGRKEPHDGGPFVQCGDCALTIPRLVVKPARPCFSVLERC